MVCSRINFLASSSVWSENIDAREQTESLARVPEGTTSVIWIALVGGLV